MDKNPNEEPGSKENQSTEKATEGEGSSESVNGEQSSTSENTDLVRSISPVSNLESSATKGGTEDDNLFTKPAPPGLDDELSKNDSDPNDDSGKSGESDRNESADEGASDNGSNSSSGSHKTKKSNRCQVCRKKVGLTGTTGKKTVVTG